MAKNNDTGLFQLENGNWAYRIFINRRDMKKIDTTCRQDENGNPFRTKKSARDAREAKLYEIKNQSKQQSKVTDVKLEEVYNSYISSNIAKGKAHSTIRKQESMWHNHIKKNFGDKFLSEITLNDLKNYLHKLYQYGDDIENYKGGYSYKYVEGFLKFFYLLFGYAYNNFWLEESIYNRMFVVRGSRLDMPVITQEDKEEYEDIKVYSPKDIKQIDAIFKRGNCYTAFLLGYFCGLRISEVFGLLIDDIDVINKTITVNKQMLYQDSTFCLCPVKTLNSVRVIDVPDILNEHLKEKIFYYLANHSKDSYRDYDIVIDKTKKQHSKIVSGAFINRKENGELLTTNSIKYWSKVIKEELGIDFLFHSLRKTHATMMANANTPVQELMARLGHKKYETTMAYYIDNNSLARDILKKNINGLDYSDVFINEPGEDPFE